MPTVIKIDFKSISEKFENELPKNSAFDFWMSEIKVSEVESNKIWSSIGWYNKELSLKIPPIYLPMVIKEVQQELFDINLVWCLNVDEIH